MDLGGSWMWSVADALVSDEMAATENVTVVDEE